MQSVFPARRYASTGAIYGPVSVCVCQSQVGVLSKLMNESGWFLAWELYLTYPKYRVFGKFGYLENKDTSLWNFAPNAGLSPR